VLAEGTGNYVDVSELNNHSKDMIGNYSAHANYAFLVNLTKNQDSMIATQLR
jgi:hypothetical protein